MIIDESSRNISLNETRVSLSDDKNETHKLLDEYEKIDILFPLESLEKHNKLKQIQDELKKYERENTMITDIINEIEGKLKLGEHLLEQDKEVQKMINIEENKEQNVESVSNMHYAVYNKYEDEESKILIFNNLEDEYPRITEKFLNKFLCSNFRLYYRTHELNDVLYLHFKGFRRIENLDTFVNLKVLYLEGNSIKKIDGLSNLKHLCSLYLHENLIERIEGLDELKELYNLNLSDNCITKIENLGNLPKLSNLLLKRNRIGLEGIIDLAGLGELQSDVTVIDISDNRIDDSLNIILDDLLVKIVNLRVLYLQGNECTRKLPNYRKSMISKLKELRYLDDRPVFEDERRFAEAFAKGGLEEERKERSLYKKEREEAEVKRIKDFQELIDSWKGKDKESNENKENQQQNFTEAERDAEKRKLLQKCKNKGKKIEIKEEAIDEDSEGAKKISNNDIFGDNDDMPSLEQVKAKKQEGYIDYILEKGRYNEENNINEVREKEEVVDTNLNKEEITTKDSNNDILKEEIIINDILKDNNAKVNSGNIFEDLD